MRDINQTIKNMGELNDTDTLCVSHGFDRGNYASAYETEDYEQAVKAINGTNGFYRVGHLLGFFSSFEIHEAPMGVQDELAHYRAVGRVLGWGFVD